MTTDKPKAPKDAAFFEQLAKMGAPMLVTAAMTVAIRKDFESLNGLVDFLMDHGSEVPAFFLNTQLTVSAPRTETGSPADCIERKNCSMATAFATAMGVRDRERRTVYSDTTPQEAVDFARRVGDLYSIPFPTDSLKRKLDVLLHISASEANDPRIFKVLVDAGADASAKFKTTTDGMTVLSLPFVEALFQHNLRSAADLIELTTPDAVKTYVDASMKSKPKSGSPATYQFSIVLGINALLNGLRLESEKVRAVLRQIDTKMTQAGHPIEASRFRLHLAALYLKHVSERRCETFTEKQTLALFGEPGDAVNEGLKGVLNDFIQKKAPKKSKNPDLDIWRALNNFVGTVQFTEVEADFLYQAARSHCVPGLALSKEVMVAAEKGGGAGLWHAINGGMPGDSGSKDQWAFQVDRFNQTLGILIAAGGDPNKIGNGNNALHVLASVKSNDSLEMLPILLALVEKPDALNDQKQRPIDILRSSNPSNPNKWQRWESIRKSHSARHSAMNLIDEIERSEKKVSP